MQNGDYLREIHTEVAKNSTLLQGVQKDIGEVKDNHIRLLEFAKSNRLYAIFAILVVVGLVISGWAILYHGTLLPEEIARSVVVSVVGAAVGILVKRSL